MTTAGRGEGASGGVSRASNGSKNGSGSAAATERNQCAARSAGIAAGAGMTASWVICASSAWVPVPPTRPTAHAVYTVLLLTLRPGRGSTTVLVPARRTSRL